MISKKRPSGERRYFVKLSAFAVAVLTLASYYSTCESAEEEPNGQLKSHECLPSVGTTDRCGHQRLENHTQAGLMELPRNWFYERNYRKAAERCRKSGPSGIERGDESGCYHWRYKYIDEQHWKGHEVEIVDKSIDERVANSLYTAISVRIVNMDFFEFASGDKEQDMRNMRSIEGSKVDVRKCGQQLGQVLQMLDEFSHRLEMKRKNASFELGVEPKHIHLARVLDAFGRYESGLFLGKTHALGGFDQCITSRLLLPSAGEHADEGFERVKTRYCWARMDLSKHLGADLRGRAPGEFEAQEKVLMLGTCLPESCHSSAFLRDGGAQTQLNRELAQRLLDTQFQLPKSLYIDQALPISTITCLPDADGTHDAPLMGKLVICFAATWVLLACYATYHQETRHQHAHHKKSDDRAPASSSSLDGTRWPSAFLECLNLKKSWQDFVEEPYDENKEAAVASETPARRKVELDVLNPIKTFGAGFVVLGHAVIIQASSSMDYMRSYNTIENDPGTLAMILGTVIVDTFFVITGVLMAYVAMRKASKMKSNKVDDDAGRKQSAVKEQVVQDGEERGYDKRAAKKHERSSQMSLFFKQWAKFAISRHLRLIPLFFLIFWFKRSYLVYKLGQGLPLTDLGFNKDTLFGACKTESWLSPLTILPGFLPLSKQCLPQSWSISADYFFSIVVTPIVLVLTKRPKLALSLVGVTILISHAMSLRSYYSVPVHMANELAQVRSHGFVFMFGYLSYLYTYPHFRLTSVLVGVAVGYLLHLYHESEKPQWPSWLRGWATKASFGAIALLFASIASIPTTKGYIAPHEREVFVHQFTTGRIIWAICNGIIIIRMSTDWKDTFLMRQFSAPYWSKLVKLNYAILLLHLDTLMFLMSSSTVIGQFSKLNIFVSYAATYLFCIPIAIMLHVLYENPVDKLVRRHVLPRVLP